MIYSEAYVDPTRGNCALFALDKHYEWMLPVSCRALRKHIHTPFDIEVWTWGAHNFDPKILSYLDEVDARVLRLPSTNQYCEGWEGRHHALCLTAYKHVFMLDVDTYVNANIPIFRDFEEDMHLNSGSEQENYRLQEFYTYFKLPERALGYRNYSVWFGEYDRSKECCKRVLQKTSDALGSGPSCYGDARVIGDQDIRNGFIHQLGASIKPMDVRVNAWISLEDQLKRKSEVLHQGHKIKTEKECLTLMERLGF